MCYAAEHRRIRYTQTATAWEARVKIDRAAGETGPGDRDVERTHDNHEPGR